MVSAIRSIDPLTGAQGAAYPCADSHDVSDVAAAAAAAHAEGVLSARPVRALLLRAIANRLRHNAGEVSALCASETGLPMTRLTAETERTAVQLEIFADLVAAGGDVEAVITHAVPGAVPPVPDIRRMLFPVGPVAVFGASNMPLAFGAAGNDVASALAAGCPVVVKGHPAHPGTGSLVARLVGEAVSAVGLPGAVYAHLLSDGFEVGEALVDAPEIAAVGFTGSISGGRALFDRAAARPNPIPVYAEMGSVNPTFVTAAAAAARGPQIAEELAASVATFGGQYCTKPGVLVVAAGEAGDALLKALAARLADAPPVALVTPAVRSTLLQQVRQLRASPEVQALTGPVVHDVTEGLVCKPVAYTAAVEAIAAVPQLLTEHFGPFVVALRWSDQLGLDRLLEALDGQLAAAIYAETGEDVHALVRRLRERVGRLVFDMPPLSVTLAAAQQHGGPYPSSTFPATSSVGESAVRRFLRPVAFQNTPAALLPPELRDDNPLGILRTVDGRVTRDAWQRDGQ